MIGTNAINLISQSQQKQWQQACQHLYSLKMNLIDTNHPLQKQHLITLRAFYQGDLVKLQALEKLIQLAYYDKGGNFTRFDAKVLLTKNTSYKTSTNKRVRFQDYSVKSTKIVMFYLPKSN